MDQSSGKNYGTTDSEKWVALFAEAIFLRPFCFPNPKFGTNAESELCDCLLVTPSGIVTIEVKESKNDARKNQEKWYKKKIDKNAFKQTATAIEAIKSGKPIFDSDKNPITIERELPIHSIAVFDNDQIKEYKGFIDKIGFEINVFSLEAFEIALKGIVSPKEFMTFLSWRYDRMKNFNYGEYPVKRTSKGALFADTFKYKDIRNDDKFSVATYIYENYGEDQLDQSRVLAFHDFSKAFADSGEYDDFVKQLSTFDYRDISLFWKKWNNALIDDGKPELRTYGHLSCSNGADIFIFCQCPENERLFPRIACYAIRRSYERHKFTKAFILVAKKNGQTGKYDAKPTSLDLSIQSQKQEFLEAHTVHLRIFNDQNKQRK